MSKKTIVTIVLLLILPLAAVFFYFNFIKPKKALSPVGEGKKVKKEFNFDYTEWQDPAGFAFEYPEGIKIDDHPEDEVNYAYLELTSDAKLGKIKILCNDSQYSDIETWSQEDSFVRDSSSLDTEVASISAKKVALGSDRELVAFIDWDEVIYTIEIESKESYWQEIYNHILSSFKLVPLEGESEEEFVNWFEGFDTSQADIVEPVEIIE